MPELPDVEIFRREAEGCLNSEIEDLTILDPKFVGITEGDFEKNFRGKRFKKTIRRGKYLFLETGTGWSVAMHFGMTGELENTRRNDEVPKFAKCTFSFKNGRNLHYISRRKLGFIKSIVNPDDFIQEKNLGPDALEVDQQTFISLLKNKKSMIKSAMTDQSVISGIGNLYSDEILFQSHIHPKTSTSDLKDNQWKEIYRYTSEVLKKSISISADPEKLPDNFLLKRREKGAECPACKGQVKVIKIAGRTTYFCPACQKK